MTTSQEMLDDLDMEDYLVHENVDYRKGSGSSGVQLNVKECPFCGGTDWKVFMNAETGLGNCFHGSCGQKFNKFTFIRALSDADSAGTFKIIKDYLRHMGWQAPRKHKFVAHHANVVLPETEQISPGSAAYDYLIKRGFGKDDIDYFSWSYCKQGSIPIIKQDGTQGDQYFNGRIILPVTDLGGELQTFQGRDITGEADRKYLFPRGYPGTGKFIYNGQNEIGKSTLVVSEGVFDVAAIKAALRADRLMDQEFGAIGTFGKHLSKSLIGEPDQYGEFIRLRFLGLERVWFMWDAERAALKAAIKAAITLKGVGFEVSICKLPEGKDPNEVDSLTVRKLIRNAKAMSLGQLARELAIVSFS